MARVTIRLTLFLMKLFPLSLAILALAVTGFGADLSQWVAEASRYESGANAEPLRQIERAISESAGNASQRAEVENALVKMLDPAATFEARRFACAQLNIIGSESSLTAIAGLLKESETVGIACLALGGNPSPKVNGLLRSALGQAEGMARVQIIVTLGDRGDTQAVKALSDLARHDQGASGLAAIRSLGKIANDVALKELAGLRQAAKPEVVRAAVWASLVAADVAARPNPSAANAIYQELLAASQPLPVRRAAFEGLLRADQDEGEKRVLATLRGTDDAMKASAIVHVRKMKSPSTSAQFAKELATLKPAAQVQLLNALAARNDPAARTAIAAQLFAEESSVRRAAVSAFATIGDASSVPVLAKALGAATSSSDQQTLEMTIAALPGGAAVDQQILGLLKTAAPATQASLVNVLARRANRTSVPAILDAADSPEPAVARAAFRALGKFGNPNDLKAILAKLMDLRAPTARGDAEAAAKAVITWSPQPERSYPAVAAALTNVQDVSARCSLISLLPACGGSQALAAVNSARADQRPQVRAAAFRALADWPGSEALDPLLELAQSENNNTERVLALRGAVRLLAGATDRSVQDVAAHFRQAMSAARNAEEKKLVLGGLSSFHDPVALTLVEPYLSDSEVQAEAALAATMLAVRVSGAAPSAARSVLKKAVALLVDNEVKRLAQDLLQTIEQFGDFILAWQVAGPFLQEGKDGKALFDAAFPPEKPGAPNVTWQIMPAGTRKDRPWQLDLGNFYGGDNRVAYARTWIYSETAQTARLETGSDDGIKAWLNSAEILAANRGGDVVPGTDKVAISLRKGWNPMVLKVVQWNSGWGFCARLTKPDGSPLEGIRAELNPGQ